MSEVERGEQRNKLRIKNLSLFVFIVILAYGCKESTKTQLLKQRTRSHVKILAIVLETNE